jgi:AcrR family transcriptional regulator
VAERIRRCPIAAAKAKCGDRIDRIRHSPVMSTRASQPSTAPSMSATARPARGRTDPGRGRAGDAADGARAPRVDDIVAEAGSSKKAFYRYFAGKDDLLLAVMERGIGIVTSYLDHQMAKAPGPKIASWIEGALARCPTHI